MGRWRITVDGTGCHHNSNAEIDADLAAREFVAKLRTQGHTLHGAKFEMVDHAGEVQPSSQNVNLLAEKDAS